MLSPVVKTRRKPVEPRQSHIRCVIFVWSDEPLPKSPLIAKRRDSLGATPAATGAVVEAPVGTELSGGTLAPPETCAPLHAASTVSRPTFARTPALQIADLPGLIEHPYLLEGLVAHSRSRSAYS